MKRNILSGIVLGVFMLLFPVMLFAANLDFTPDQTEVRPDSTFEVQVTVDPGTQQISGTDIWLAYDPTYLELSSVASGGYFPIFDNNPSSGKLYIAGTVSASGEYKTGLGTVAAVTFKALQEGTTTLSYDCDLTDEDNTSKIIQNDVSTSNIIDCSANETHSVTISTSAPETPSTTTTNNSTTSTGTQLPASGVYEDMLRYATMGGILLFMGILLRVLLRIV